MNRALLVLALWALPFLCFGQNPPPKRELRGAWIATFSNIDWPSRTATPASQQSTLITILNHHQQTGMNAVYLQVRSQCDALYPSTIEPWSADLTGTQGRAPNPLWDPLQFALTETHRRGMEFHAWINPYRVASSASSISGFAANHVAKVRPEWTLTVGNGVILNPGLPQVRDYVTSVIVDILTRYDVDGIHFDDYFYPSGTINDDAAFNADPRGFTSRADWRRDNVNLLVKKVYDTIRAIKPWVKFGISPSGIYRNSTNSAIGTATSGLEHYTTNFADSKKWLEQGWLDYLAPQVYWYIGQPGANYSVIVPWWNSMANGRHIYIGMAGYKVNDATTQGTPWTQPTMIPSEMRLNRQQPNVRGQIVYNTSSLRSTTRLGFRDSLRLFFYQKPALQPTMPWRDNTAPDAATNLSAQRYADDSVVLRWTNPPQAANELDRVRRLVVYRSTSPSIDLSDANNILFITVNDTTAFRDVTPAPGQRYFYAVTTLDRFHNESAASNLVADVLPTITCPADAVLNLNAQCATTLPDYTTLATVSHATSLVQSPAAGTALNGAGATQVTLTATNAVGQTATCTFTVTTRDVTPPMIGTVPSNPSIVSTDAGQCSHTAGTAFDIAATDNCGPLSYSYRLQRPGWNSGWITASSLSGTVFPKGDTRVTWKVADAAGNSAEYVFDVRVKDNEAPVIANAAADPSVLWSPNRRMHLVTVSYDASDNCGAVTTSLSVSSNEPSNGAPDWVIVDNHHVRLRAERNGNGNGRIYTITIRAVDGSGNESTKQVTVHVPHDQGNNTGTRPGGQVAEVVEWTAAVSPNPSRDAFRIHLSSIKEPASLLVYDATGRVVERRAGLSAGTLTLGESYRPGVYVVEIRCDGRKQSLKLVKVD